MYRTILFALLTAYAATLLAECEPENTKTFALTVMDEAGKPIPHAKLLFGGMPAPLHSEERMECGEVSAGMSRTQTDENGRYLVHFPVKELADIQCLFFWIDTPGYAPYNGFWNCQEDDPIPSEFSVKLEKAAVIGGWVQNSEGKPIAGASITLVIPWEKQRVRREPNSNTHVSEIATDENGAWKYESLPLTFVDKPTGAMIARVAHEDYMTLEDWSENFFRFLPDDNGEFKGVFTLADGIPIKGRVTDESGQPIADALVVGHYRSTMGIVRLNTDNNGEFTVKNWPERRDHWGEDCAYLAVRKPGFKTALKSFDIEGEEPLTIDFVLKPIGKPIKIKIVDEEGKPVPNYTIALARWNKSRLIAADLFTGKPNQRGLTDHNGQWTWIEAPDDEVVFDMFDGKRMDLRDVKLKAQNEEHVLTAFPMLKITGKVLDDGGQPVPTFKVFFGIKFENRSDFYWDLKANAGKDGFYSLSEHYPQAGFGVKIEAEGYAPAISRLIKSNEGSITIDFSLRPPSEEATVEEKLSEEELAKLLHGTVLTPDGQFAADATVLLSTFKSNLSINGQIQINAPDQYHHGHNQYHQIYGSQSDLTSYIIKTDKQGRFRFSAFDFPNERYSGQTFPPEFKVSDYAMGILHDSGYRLLSPEDMETTYKDKPITLEKWGRIEGTFYSGTKPVKDVRMRFFPSDDYSGSPDKEISPKIQWRYWATTDAEGKFAFERVPASSGNVQREFDSNQFYIDVGIPNVEVRSGETSTINFGGVGRPVIGKLVPETGLKIPRELRDCAFLCSDPVAKREYEEVRAKQHRLITQSLFSNGIDSHSYMAILEEWKETTEDGKAFARLAQESQPLVEKHYGRQLQFEMSKDGTFRIDNVPEGDWQLEVEWALQVQTPWGDGGMMMSRNVIGRLEYHFTMDAIPGGVSDEPLDLGMLTVEKVEQPKPQ